MSIIYFLIGCSVLLALIFLGAFFWAQRNGQHDDLYTPSVRILLDDESPADEKSDTYHPFD
ncbi:MAG: cbb3-type cytochrome oxidase assembly protein CcoS [Sphingobacteriales bacterium]|nr:MAG: cbb3-type cytochrome oxidase assembly protein CcoS [Sphingobacteriales bacterium]